MRCCGWRFRLTATHFFYKRLKKVSKKTLAPTFGPRKLGSLRCGTDPGAAATVCFAAPPSAVFDFVERSLRSHTRINPSAQPSDVAGGSKARSEALELALIVEWGGFAAGSCAALLFCGSEPARDCYLKDTKEQRIYPDPCGSWLASDGGLPADQSLADIYPIPTVGASLLAKAS